MKLNIFRGERQEAKGSPSESNDFTPLVLSAKKIEKILVAVDFSEASRKALQFAATLANQLRAEIVLLHVFEGVPGELKILEASFVETSFREEAQENLSEWRRDLESLVGKVTTVFREGSATGRQIVEVAVEFQADLIVLGRHGPRSYFLNNTVKKVLARAPCPVLVGE